MDQSHLPQKDAAELLDKCLSFLGNCSGSAAINNKDCQET
jgi:hypothetical protein